jgi:toxin ParE1/3/4
MPEELKKVFWSPQSKRDLREVWRYYQRVASAELADRLLREIAEAGQRLSREAVMWRRRDEVWQGLRSVPVRPYMIFYRVNEDVVEIVRIIHEQRDLARIFGSKER